MDWLGGGDTIVRNAFFRASDDIFALQGNWDGYRDADLLRPGHDVQKILIEHSVLSTSISNIVRAGWPRKVYNSSNFTLRDSDILHGGIGACGQSFGLLGFWGADGARGNHANYTFENLFLDHWYSLVQIEQERPALRGVAFHNIWALDQPPLVSSTLLGDVAGVSFDNVKYGQNRVAGNADLPLTVALGAAPVTFAEPSLNAREQDAQEPVAAFRYDPPALVPHKTVTFTAQFTPGAHYTWLFGDGTQAIGRRVRHRFPDAEGTELNGAPNGAGRFRVMLHVEKPHEDPDSVHQDWAAQGLVVVSRWREATAVAGLIAPGLAWSVYPGLWTELPELAAAHPVFVGESPNLRVDARGFTHYAAAWDGFLEIPADGGYTFHLLARDGARLVIDGVEVVRTGPPFAQVCDSPGNAVRYALGSLGLRAGKHRLHVESLYSASQSAPRLLWEGPGVPLAELPAASLTHLR
jgi:hypothetical protein